MTSLRRDGPRLSRDDPPIGPKEDGPGKRCLSLRLASQLQPLGPRLAPESSVAGPARVARCFAETREFPDSTGRVAVWGADADRSKLRGAGAARPGGVSSPSIGTPSVCTVVLARTPDRPRQRVKNRPRKKCKI